MNRKGHEGREESKEKAKRFDRFREKVNPWLRRLLNVEITTIWTHAGEWIGVGVRRWLQ